MLSARGEEYDKIHGFELGIDDYVVKPFSPKELMMRIDAIMKRTSKDHSDEHELYQKDSLIADFTARRILINNENIEMSPKEFDLIFYFDWFIVDVKTCPAIHIWEQVNEPQYLTLECICWVATTIN